LGPLPVLRSGDTPAHATRHDFPCSRFAWPATVVARCDISARRLRRLYLGMQRTCHIKSSRAKSSQVEPNRAKSNQVVSSRVKSCQVVSSRVEPRRVKSSRVESNRINYWLRSDSAYHLRRKYSSYPHQLPHSIVGVLLACSERLLSALELLLLFRSLLLP